MTNSERYRSAFSHVRAPSGCVQQALEQASSPQNARPKRRPLRRMVILAAAAAILTMSVGAELSDGSVSNLLAPSTAMLKQNWWTMWAGRWMPPSR